jgi:hypothetical protein
MNHDPRSLPSDHRVVPAIENIDPKNLDPVAMFIPTIGIASRVVVTIVEWDNKIFLN